MSCESYKKIYEDHAEGAILRPRGRSRSFRFKLTGEEDKSYRLFATGETGLFYQWKNEPDNHLQYRTICDALDPNAAERGTYALKLSSKKPEGYVRRAYKKILWPPKLSYINMNPVPDEWELGFYVKTTGLTIESGGYLRMRADIRYEHEGVSVEVNTLPADESVTIDVPAGSTVGYVKHSKPLRLPAGRVASVGIFIEGVRYSGEVYFDKPYLVSPEIPDKGVLPDFSMPVPDREYYDWTGQNLSRKEWPEFRLTLNGTVFFDGEVFERCHRESEWSVDIPRELLRGECELSIELTSDYHDALPYTLTELGIVETPAGEFALLSTSETAPSGGVAHALIRTERDGVTVSARYFGELSGKETFTFDKKGLHGISFRCGAPSQNAAFELSSGEKKERGTVKRIVLKDDDFVYTGTGDLIYIQEERASFEEYLIWYLSSGIGNLLTIRPTYRWGGSRILNEETFRELVRVLNEWGVKYSHMLDGRELPGICANPDEALLAGEGFLGRQMHERDGACFYWRRYAVPNSDTERQARDLRCEAFREDPTHYNAAEGDARYIFGEKATKELSTAPTFDGDAVASDSFYQYRDPTLPKDARVAHDEAVRRLALESYGNPRHTGPSTMFKYLFEGGYKWLGAETMYGTMEPLLAFLRGAGDERGVSSRGVHHALQWSSSPEDAPEHVRRYRLALYVSYLQGATEINTEEGLWRLEEYYSHFHRFSAACREHLKQQTDFYRYVATHTRRGKFYTPMGLIQGRYDGWHGFGKNSAWGWQGFTDTDAEKSWELLSVFYPEGNLGESLYFHGFPADKPLGFYSSTPHGNVDVIPAEQRRDTYENYKAIAFMGYNCLEEGDAEKLARYVAAGGHLLMTRAHLTRTTNYADVAAGRLEYFANPLSFTDGEAHFETRRVSGVELSVCTNTVKPDEVIAACDDGTPLVCRYKLGHGTVTLFNASAYPAHPAIRALYEKELEEHARYAAKDEPTWAIAKDGTEFAVYKCGDETDVYFLAVDWYRTEVDARHTTLTVGGTEHDVSLPFGVMIKAATWQSFAAYPHSEDGEAISVKGGIAKLQGCGKVKFTLINGEAEREIELDFSEASIAEVKI